MPMNHPYRQNIVVHDAPPPELDDYYLKTHVRDYGAEKIAYWGENGNFPVDGYGEE